MRAYSRYIRIYKLFESNNKIVFLSPDESLSKDETTIYFHLLTHSSDTASLFSTETDKQSVEIYQFN